MTRVPCCRAGRPRRGWVMPRRLSASLLGDKRNPPAVEVASEPWTGSTLKALTKRAPLGGEGENSWNERHRCRVPGRRCTLFVSRRGDHFSRLLAVFIPVGRGALQKLYPSRRLGFYKLKAELGGLLFELFELLKAIAFLVVLHPLIYVLLTVLQHPIHQSG